jgi:hypothetical protein
MLVGWRKSSLGRALGSLCLGLARILSDVASPKLRTPNSPQLPLDELIKLAALARLDFGALQEGHVEVRYRALDPIWLAQPQETCGMVPLREHVLRLCEIAEELSCRGHSNDWSAVSESLHLAASLEDLSANTDVQNTSFMCGSAAEFDDANSEVAAKFVAGAIVFNLVWAAYEWTVEIASEPFGMKQPKGARGRDLLVQLLGDKHFPYLRGVVLEALDLSSGKCVDFSTHEMRRLIAAGSMAGIGAEHLRKFRNALAHGALRKPTPQDWGPNSEYVADNDPAIRNFHANTRLTLLLIQILMRSALNEFDQLKVWLPNSQPAKLVLTQLHCELPESLDCGEALPLEGVPLLRNW